MKPSKRRPKTFERCVQHVKDSNRKQTGNPLRPYNPWAICNASVRGLHARKNPSVQVLSEAAVALAIERADLEVPYDAPLVRVGNVLVWPEERAAFVSHVKAGKLRYSERSADEAEIMAAIQARRLRRNPTEYRKPRHNPVLTFELIPTELRDWNDLRSRDGIKSVVDRIYETTRTPVVVTGSGRVLAIRAMTGWSDEKSYKP